MRIFNLLANKYFLFFSRIFLGSLFIYASFYKIISPEDFAISINRYRILPDCSNNFFAVTIPFLEFFSGLMLVSGYKIRANSLIITSLLFIFLIALISAYLRGINIDCGCFSANAGGSIGFREFIRDILLLILSLNLIINRNNFLSIDQVIL